MEPQRPLQRAIITFFALMSTYVALWAVLHSAVDQLQ